MLTLVLKTEITDQLSPEKTQQIHCKKKKKKSNTLVSMILGSHQRRFQHRFHKEGS